jgi:glycosyltransferase involved in cell wall biosynthesis
VLSRLVGRPFIYHDRILLTHGVVERAVRFQASVILAITEAVAAKWNDHARQKTRVFLDGTDVDRNRPMGDRSLRGRVGIDAESVAVLAVSRIAREKRIDDLIEALEPLRAKVVLLVAGQPYQPEDELYASELERLASARGVRCEFLGFVEDMRPVYEASDIFALPSLAEPFGQVVIEAMAMEKAIIAARSAGPMEILDDDRTGVFFQPGDVADLSSKLARLVGDIPLRARLGQAARTEVEKRFAISRVVVAFERLLESLAYQERTNATAE